jgi:hypothetical protein
MASMNSLVNFSEERYMTFTEGAALGDVLADGLHEVGLAEADAAVDEEGIVSAGGRLGDGEGGGMGELVVHADDEGDFKNLKDINLDF